MDVSMKIGCIGQGFVGKNIADDFENREYEVVRYSLEPQYSDNADMIGQCDIVFIGVPTPSTPEGFDYSIIKKVLPLVSDGSVVVIKSTVLPGTTAELQSAHPDKIVLFSPEFLCETTAAYDVANPIMNVIGVSLDTDAHKKAGERVMGILPKSPHNSIVTSQTAELYKYAHNLNGYMRVILSNLLYEVGEKKGAQWEDMKQMMDNDPMMSAYYNSPVHKDGRGAGGNCFIKDMAAFRHLYQTLLPEDQNGLAVLQSLEKKNLELLRHSNKSQDLVRDVYGV
ncbi:MAG: UDP-glucose 6-dehydrogenase [Candidatus Azotimanducaceae bacterium]|jgi:UDP-glucose 6-dehydrogenase